MPLSMKPLGLQAPELGNKLSSRNLKTPFLLILGVLSSFHSSLETTRMVLASLMSPVLPQPGKRFGPNEFSSATNAHAEG